MRERFRIILSGFGSVYGGGCAMEHPPASANACSRSDVPAIIRAAGINVETATVADLQAAFQKGTLTSEKLTQIYLGRIEAYDKRGPAYQRGHHAQSQCAERRLKRSMPNAKPGKCEGLCTAFRWC